MTKPTFTVIEGGLASPQLHHEKYFISAYVTDTRLMGVTGLYIHWRLPDKFATPDFHQFFYFDAEEYGFENYKSLLGNDVEELALIEQALIGGLGGNKVEISEKEARALVCHYVAFNQTHDIPLPDDKAEYDFIVNGKSDLSPDETHQLMSKLCVEVSTDYQAINYFLMRCFGKDFSGAAFLMAKDFDVNLFPEYNAATLCKNTIDPDEEGSYMCESLIEFDDEYYLVITQIFIEDLKVVSWHRCSGFHVSAIEAGMMLSRPEFVTLYELLIDPDDLSNSMDEITSRAMITNHESGKLFLTFNTNNNHVNKRVFLLSEDVFGLYYVTDYGQLIAASYSIQGIHCMERDLRKSPMSTYIIPSAKYEFKEPILYDFIQSDFEDFSIFLDYIRNE